MTFEEDIDQTRMKNSSFGKPNFSVQVHSRDLIFWFERACEDAVQYRASFFKLLLFKGRKRIETSMIQKTL